MLEGGGGVVVESDEVRGILEVGYFMGDFGEEEGEVRGLGMLCADLLQDGLKLKEVVVDLLGEGLGGGEAAHLKSQL